MQPQLLGYLVSFDLQGLAVAVEHAVPAMGGGSSDDQLFQFFAMFKVLWAVTEVERLLKANHELARNGAYAKDWPRIKAKLATLETKDETGAIAANLVLAHRLRGAVHYPVHENDQFELERYSCG